MTDKTPLTARELSTFRTKFASLVPLLHTAEFDLANLLGVTLAKFQSGRSKKAVPPTLRFRNFLMGEFTLHHGVATKYVNMGIEAQRFVKLYRKKARENWNRLGGWTGIVALNGIVDDDARNGVEKALIKEARDLGAPVSVSFIRKTIHESEVEVKADRGGGRPNIAQLRLQVAELLAAITGEVAKVQAAGLKARTKRTDADNERLAVEASVLVRRVARNFPDLGLEVA